MDPSERVFHARLEEYRATRDEIIQSIHNQHLVLTFGTAAFLAAFGAGFVAWDKPVGAAIFFATAPLSWWILTMWSGEVVRMLRAAEFYDEQADLINDSIRALDPKQPAPLRWEKWRRDPDVPRRTIASTYISVAILLALTNLAAMACGTAAAIDAEWSRWTIAAAWGAVLLTGLPFVGWVQATFKTWSRAEVGLPSSSALRAFGRF